MHEPRPRVLPDDGSQLLLVIDQFEELFTQVDPATANRFLANLVPLSPTSRVAFESSSRCEPTSTIGRCNTAVSVNCSATGPRSSPPMTPQELERAITGLAERHGVTFEPASWPPVGEVTDRPARCRSVQYTLTELFENRTGNRIGFATYAELERGVRCVGEAPRAVDEPRRRSGRGRPSGVPPPRHLHRGRRTRRRVLQSELEDLDVDRRLLRSVLDAFGRHRLLSFDRDPITRSPTVEISHEALLTEWTRLRDWIDGARNDVRIQRRLADAMREWVAAERADDYRCAAVCSIRSPGGRRRPIDVQVSGPERAFLGASIANAIGKRRRCSSASSGLWWPSAASASAVANS